MYMAGYIKCLVHFCTYAWHMTLPIVIFIRKNWKQPPLAWKIGVNAQSEREAYDVPNVDRKLTLNY